jgi:ferric enterobactin receptor
MQMLPGVVGTLEGSSELYVRGSTPDQTSISVDGFTLYPMKHLAGTFAGLNPASIQSAEFSQHSTDASVGGHLGGTVRLVGASGGEKPSAAVEIGALGASGHASAPLGTRASVLVAARHSPPSDLYDDALGTLRNIGGTSTPDAVARFSGGLFPAAPRPEFWDVNAKLDVKATASDRVSVTYYAGRDAANQSRAIALDQSTDLKVPDAIALPQESVAQLTDVHRWEGTGVSGIWSRTWSPSASTTVSIGHSTFSKDAQTSSLLFSPTTNTDYSFVAGRGGSNGLAESNRISDTTARLSHLMRVGFDHYLSMGGEIVSIDTAYDAQTEVLHRSASTGAVSSFLTPLLNESRSGRLSTVFAQDTWRPLSALTISPGFRLTQVQSADAVYFDPRASVTYVVRPELRLTAGASIDHQAAMRITREDRVRGDGEFWTLADGKTLSVPVGHQASVGAIVEIPNLLWTAHAYVKRIEDLSIFAPRTFPGVLQNAGGPLMHQGSSASTGIEMLVQQRTDWNTFWAAYSISRTDYTFPTLEAATFPASFDQTHELKLADTVRISGGVRVGAVFLVGSGRPETVATGASAVWFPTGETVFQPTFGPKNAGRLPAYHRLDLSAERVFRARALAATIGIQVFNVYNQYNVLYSEYETVGSNVAVSNVTLIPRAFNVFLRLGL